MMECCQFIWYNMNTYNKYLRGRRFYAGKGGFIKKLNKEGN